MKVKEKYIELALILFPWLLLLYLFSHFPTNYWWEQVYEIVAITVGPAITAACFHYKLFE